MSEIKTAKQRIHKLEGGEGDSFVTFEQALIAERDELRAALRKALAERDALARCKLADQDAYVAMRYQRDAARADALRYRWLRKTTKWVNSKGNRIDVRNSPELWDASIDAAMKGEQP